MTSAQRCAPLVPGGVVKRHCLLHQRSGTAVRRKSLSCMCICAQGLQSLVYSRYTSTALLRPCLMVSRRCIVHSANIPFECSVQSRWPECVIVVV